MKLNKIQMDALASKITNELNEENNSQMTFQSKTAKINATLSNCNERYACPNDSPAHTFTIGLLIQYNPTIAGRQIAII